MNTSEADWQKRLGLGTVQLGLDYGISNKNGQASLADAGEILSMAYGNNIPLLDTAATYGNSEEVIGAVVAERQLKFDIISKLPPNCAPSRVKDSILDTLRHLNSDNIYGYLAHSYTDFTHSKLRNALQATKKMGLVSKVGVSLYFPSEAEWILENNIDIDVIQIPFNVFDQRFKPLLTDLKSRNIEIHARSAFLQGLFFLDPEESSRRFPEIQERLNGLHTLCGKSKIPISVLLLNFVIAQRDIDKVLIGVNHASELRNNLGSYAFLDACNALEPHLHAFATDDEDIVIPYKWQNQ